MFIRAIKMINERADETIGRLLSGDKTTTTASDVSSEHELPATQTPSAQHPRVKLEPMIEFLSDRESAFEADAKVCQLIESGVRALFGPIDGASVAHVQSICDNMEIPYFELRAFLGSPAMPTASIRQQQQQQLLLDAQRPPNMQSRRNAAPQQQQQQECDEAAKQYLSCARRHPPSMVLAASGAQATSGAEFSSSGDDSDVAAERQQQQQKQYNDNRRQRLDRRSRLNANNHDSDGAGGGGGERTSVRNDYNSEWPSATPQAPDPASGTRAGNTPTMSSGSGSGGAQSAPTLRVEGLTLNVYPPAYLLNRAYIDLIYAWNWSSFAIVYEDPASMIRLQDLFRESSGSWTSRWQIKLFQFDSSSSSSHSADAATAQATLSAPAAHDRPQRRATAAQGRRYNDSDSRAKELEPQTGSAANDNELNGRLAQRPEERALVESSEPNDDDGDDDKARAHANEPSRRLRKRAMGARAKQRNARTFRDIFWQIKMSGEQNILLDVRVERLHEALKHAQQVGCMTEHYSYLVTSLDLATLELEDFKYSRTRMTALSLVQVQRAVAAAADDNDGAFDERYLEKLGVRVPSGAAQSSDTNNRPAKNPSREQTTRGVSTTTTTTTSKQEPINKLSPSIVLQKSGEFMEPPSEVYSREWVRREQLQSQPASMGLLPTVDRDNERKLFEFLLEQQERNLSRARLSTTSALLHDSLLLYAMALAELDPSGELLSLGSTSRAGSSASCAPNARALAHGTTMVNYMRRTSFHGLSGHVSFDPRGLRADFKLDVLGMAPDIGLVKVGEWHSRSALSPNKQLAPDATKSGGGDDDELTSADAHENSSDNVDDDDDNANNNVLMRPVSAYDRLSERYERELVAYKAKLARGEHVHVPYEREMSRSGALRVNTVIYERLYREQVDEVDTLIVTTKLSQPYFMLKETPNKLEGNDQYEGFAVDLIHELSKLVNFRYRWREVADKKYGIKTVLSNGTVVWNGMIGEIVRGVADLAIVDLTITAQREEAVDFTLPFMNTGISILFKKPTTKVTTLFSFLSPFSSDVWAYVLAAYCGISATLFLVGHVSPYEWANPHPCRHLTPGADAGQSASGSPRVPPLNGTQTKSVTWTLSGSFNDDADNNNNDSQTPVIIYKNQFSLLNAFWFTIGSLMQQGSDLTPRSMSTRTIAGIWYFFTLIMISSYTANLAAFLTVEKVVYPIENVRDLSNQDEIRYGCVESGSTRTFFHDSQIDTYKKINETMRKFRTYVRSNDDGQKRVEEGKFAFFMESTSIEYIVERNCNLTQIGGLLDSKGYGLATSKKSRLRRPYRTLLSEAILHLQETGMLHILKNRWWKERRGGGTCTDDGKGGGVTELSLANVGGVFVVLLGGLGISFLVAIAEFMWRARRNGASRDRMCDDMMRDLKFALACKRSTKPVEMHRSHASASCSMSSSSSVSSSCDNHVVDAAAASASANQSMLANSRFFDARDDDHHHHGARKKPDNGRRSAAARKRRRKFAHQRIAPTHHRGGNGNGGRSSPNELEQSARTSAATAQTSSSKSCDPILLHAMLSVLLSQQQEQQQQQQLQLASGGQTTDQTHMANASEWVGHAATSARMYAAHAGVSLDNQPNPGADVHNPANRRRLLFAHNTMHSSGAPANSAAAPTNVASATTPTHMRLRPAANLQSHTAPQNYWR